MTPEEKMLWDYVDEESSDLALKVMADVEHDGFNRGTVDERVATELVAIKVLSAATIKTLALLVEKVNHPDLVGAYMQMVPMHVDLVKTLVMKDFKQRAGS